ncbi:MAG: YicC family protein [Deltaproteobacteria bacterium]|nr:YicC family protein [Deltaproteobacteria bacterium]
MKSMTGYGTAEGNVGKGRLFIEIKSMNHRFCEVITRLPPKMGSIEGLFRKKIQDHFLRGKIEIFVKEKTSLFGGSFLTVDADLAQGYQACFQKLARTLRINPREDFLRYVGIDRFITVMEREGSYERLWRSIEQLLLKAMRQVDRMRIIEGNHTARDQRKRLRRFSHLVAMIHTQSSRALDHHLDRMRRRMVERNVVVETEGRRFEEEAATLASRQDIAEELTRLESHAAQYSSLLRERGAVGRKLDFLLQEMNREINTIGSKAADSKISVWVVECKAELERLREQVQNVE